jgi:RNase P/RNase MRP subunit p30
MNDINFFKHKDSLHFRKISSKKDLEVSGEFDGYLIDAEEKEVRRIIDSLKGAKKIFAVLGRDGDFNRRAIETLKINYLVSPERGNRKDSLKQRDSGLNHVVAKEAVKKKIAIVISPSTLEGLSGKDKALEMERMIQNVDICKKAECEIKIASLADNLGKAIDEKARRAFGVTLGMSSLQSKKSVDFSP